jgi:hypothetical protein
MQVKTITTLLITILALTLAACNKQAPPVVILPEFLESYERYPFSDQHFGVFKRVFDPVWDKLKPKHKMILLSKYGISRRFSREQTIQAIQQNLGDDWFADPDLSQDSKWGWSVGFRNGRYVFVLVVANDKLIDFPEDAASVPAGIVSDAIISSDKISSR